MQYAVYAHHANGFDSFLAVPTLDDAKYYAFRLAGDLTQAAQAVLVADMNTGAIVYEIEAK